MKQRKNILELSAEDETQLLKVTERIGSDVGVVQYFSRSVESAAVNGYSSNSRIVACWEVGLPNIRKAHPATLAGTSFLSNKESA